MTLKELDMDLLKRRDPVYWFDSVLLYEDELHDNGISHVSVKVCHLRACVFLCVKCVFWLVIMLLFFMLIATPITTNYNQLQPITTNYNQLQPITTNYNKHSQQQRLSNKK